MKDYVCKTCDGRGKIEVNRKNFNKYINDNFFRNYIVNMFGSDDPFQSTNLDHFKITCCKCKGTGFVDWVGNCMPLGNCLWIGVGV